MDLLAPYVAIERKEPQVAGFVRSGDIQRTLTVRSILKWILVTTESSN